MKLQLLKRFNWILCILFLTTQMSGQISLGFDNNVDPVVVCGDVSENEFNIIITDDVNQVIYVQLNLPSGVHYVPGSLNIEENLNLELIEEDLTIPNRPIFRSTGSSYGTEDAVTFTIERTADCDAIDFVNAGNVARDSMVVSAGNVSVDSFSSNYNVNYPSFFLSYVNNSDINITVNSLPDTVCRPFQIVNGGTGYANNIHHRVIVGNDLVDYALVFEGDTISPTSQNGDTLWYDFDLKEAPFFGNFEGDVDSILQNGEKIILDECMIINDCDFSAGNVKHQSSIFCNEQICQFSNEINGRVSLSLNGPNLSSAVDSLDNIVCLDGTDFGLIRMKIWNSGNGAGLLDQITLSANGPLTSIDVSSFSVKDTLGNDLSSNFMGVDATIDNGLSCGSGTTTYRKFNDGNSPIYVLNPGDTVFVEMRYVQCCPTTCGPATLANPNITVTASNLCGGGRRNTTVNAGAGGDASISNPIISGPSFLGIGETGTICLVYPNFDFFNVLPLDSSYVGFVLELPTGLEYETGSFEISYNNVAIPTLEENEIGMDSLFVKIPLGAMPVNAYAPIEICFDVTASCVDAGEGTAQMTFGQSVAIDCDPDCLIKLRCNNYTMNLPGCPMGPGECADGGGEIFDYQIQRVSLGYEDINNDRNWETFNKADSSQVNLERMIVGDTMRNQITLGFNEGDFTQWDRATYYETYSNNGVDVLCFDTAWLIVESGMNTYQVGGIPATDMGDGFSFDLSVATLSSLSDSNLPSNHVFTEGDSIYLRTKYIFCKEKASDWFSIEPGTLESDSSFQNITAHAGFRTIPVGEDNESECGSAYSGFELIGSSLSVEAKSGGFSGDGCDRNFRYLFEIKQNIGGVSSGETATYDFFPNEFRPLYIPDSIVITKQENYDYTNARLVTTQIDDASLEVATVAIDPKYETSDIIVFDIRALHEAFTMSMSDEVYEEENVTLQYYVEFGRNCASERQMVTNLSIAYTSPLCPGDNFVTEKMDLSTGNNSDLGNIRLTQDEQIKSAFNNNTCFELTVRPQGGQLNYSWFEIVNVDGIEIQSVSQGGTIVDLEDGIYKLGHHSNNSNVTYDICATTNQCEVGSFDVIFGWDCFGYPGDFDYIAACSYDTVTYMIESVQSEVMLDLLEQPGSSGNYPGLCEQLMYGLQVNSANAGSVLNPRLEVSLPTGFDIDYVEVEYPNGSNAETIAHVVSGGTLFVNLFDHTYLVNDSLPGTATTTNVAPRQLYVRLFGRTDCDFRSGSELYFKLLAEKPCGDAVKGSNFVVVSDKLIIDGLLPYEADPEFILDIDNTLSCTGASEVGVEFVIANGGLKGDNWAKIYLPAGVKYQENSLMCSSMFCPVLDSVSIDPDVIDGHIIWLSYPDLLMEGDTLAYTFEVLSDETLACGDRVDIRIENLVTIEGVECGNMVCAGGLTGITGSSSTTLEVVHSTLTFNSFTANQVVGTDYMSVLGSVSVADRDLLALDSFNIEFYCADVNGDPVGMPVRIVEMGGPLIEGNTLPFETSFENMCMPSDSLYAVITPVNFCVCTEINASVEVESEVRTFDLALTKFYNGEGLVAYGDTVQFGIRVINQGDVNASNYEVVDYLPAGLQYVDDNNSDGWVYDVMDNQAYKTVNTPLLVGQTDTVYILVKVLDVMGANVYDNYAEISLDGNEFGLDDDDSVPDSTQTNDYGAIPNGDTDDEEAGDGKDPNNPMGEDDIDFDEDDHDVARLNVVDFALIKVIDTLNSEYPWQFGNIVAFNIIVQNQAVVPSDSIVVRDYVPAGFAFDPGLIDNVNQGWNADSTVVLRKRLLHNEKDTVTIYLEIQSVNNPDMNSWINYAEIIAAYDTMANEIAGLDYDSQPDSDSEEEREIRPEENGDNDFESTGRNDVGSEDDHDPAGVMFLDLALFKQVDSVYTQFPVKYGDLIKFNISVINQDGVMVDSVQVKDYIPDGYSFDPNIPENQAFGWTSDRTAVIAGPMNVGDTVTTSIYLTLLQHMSPTDRTWVNYSEIDSAWSMGMEVADVDIDSDPHTDSPEERDVYPEHPGDDDVNSTSINEVGSEDDHDPAYVEVFDLALKKTTAEEVAYPGLEAQFDITVYNQGGIPATNIEITDYVRTGYHFDATLNSGWTGSDPLITYVITDTLYPNESIVIPVILTVTEDIDPDNLINVAEISGAQDTSLMDREDVDGTFDNMEDNDAGGQLDSPADNYVDGDGTGDVDGSDPATDEDNADPAKILPCPPVNCYSAINLGFNSGCELVITPDMLLVDNLLARLRPDFYRVELSYGAGIPIQDNILRPHHVGFKITARITFLLQACGGGSCETTIILEKPSGCIITNTLDTVVYCIDPFLKLDPLSAAYPKPEVQRPCVSGNATLNLGTDWIDADFDCDNDTAEIIYREWFAKTPSGETCSAFDTIVVMRIPKLLPTSFIDHSEETFYCTAQALPASDYVQKRFVSWKQAIGIHDYELPYSKLRGVTYDLPVQVIEKYWDQAVSLELEDEYLACPILYKANGDVVTLGDILNGSYMSNTIASANSSQLGYGVLHLISEGNLSISQFDGFSFYPYLLLEIGDRVLSANGQYEEVQSNWFYNGHGNTPYWMAGGWPDVYGGASVVSFCDGYENEDFDCISIVLPRLTENGYDPVACDTLCLTEGVHCGIGITKTVEPVTGLCPQKGGIKYDIMQTCWASSTAAEAAMLSCSQGDGSVVDSYSESRSRLLISVSRWEEMQDTMGPIFDFAYPLGSYYTGCSPQQNVSGIWDAADVLASVQSGEQYIYAQALEYCQPTVYTNDETDCGAEVYVPSVDLIDQCSGISQVKATVNAPGGLRTVLLVRTGSQQRVLQNGDICTVVTYSHITKPIYLPFTGCEGDLHEVKYEAADSCWNQSSWTKYVQIQDANGPTIVMDDDLDVFLQSDVAWIEASSLDEGSYDNCHIELSLARRSDWISDPIFDNLCGSLNNGGNYTNWVDVLVDLGFNRNQVLSAQNGQVLPSNTVDDAYNITALRSVFEAGTIGDHYYKELIWMWEDGARCGAKVIHAWAFELATHIAAQCNNRDEHGNPLYVQDLEQIFDNLFDQPGYGKEMLALGGGWSQKVPYQCEDVCTAVSTELLAIDQCCNWSKGWLDIHVKDLRPIHVQSPLQDVSITCEAYNSFYKDIAVSASGDNAQAIQALDSIFGEYIFVRLNKQGRLTDLAGTLMNDEDVEFDYQDLVCGEKITTAEVLELNHELMWEATTVTTSAMYLDTIGRIGQKGLILVNCSGAIRQDVWIDLDDCSQGKITRRFFVSNGCESEGEEVLLEQVINIESACGMRLSMFDIPADKGSMDAPVCLAAELNKNTFHDSLGVVQLKPSLLGQICNSIAIGKIINAYDIVGRSDIKKYEINWKLIDWCASATSNQRELNYKQIIIAKVDGSCGIIADSTVSISGNISTDLGSPVSEVAISAFVNGKLGFQNVSSATGDYQFELVSGMDLSVVPEKNIDFSEGVSTQDLIAIQSHVMKKAELEGEYRKIAADVNGNGIIEVNDFLELRTLVLNPNGVLNNNTSWRFVNSVTGKEIYQNTEMSKDEIVDFVGVKIGDVNQSSDPATSNRSLDGVLELEVADQKLYPGETYHIEVRSNNFLDVQGMQYTLEYNAAFVDLVEIESGVLNISESNYLDYQIGRTTFSWHNATSIDLTNKEVLYTLVMRPKKEVDLHDVLTLSSRVIHKEAYLSTGKATDVKLSFGQAIEGYRLHQNKPNPFKEVTTIGFDLPIQQSAIIHIYDVTGRLLETREGEFNKGYNEVEFRSGNWPNAGVLFYQLISGEYRAMKPMVLIK